METKPAYYPHFETVYLQSLIDFKKKYNPGEIDIKNAIVEIEVAVSEFMSIFKRIETEIYQKLGTEIFTGDFFMNFMSRFKLILEIFNDDDNNTLKDVLRYYLQEYIIRGNEEFELICEIDIDYNDSRFMNCFIEMVRDSAICNGLCDEYIKTLQTIN